MSKKHLEMQVEDVSFVFGEGEKARYVLSHISATLRESHILAITGPSGCGKTTLLRLMSGLLSPTSGAIRRMLADGREPKIGFMFQEHKLIPWLKIRDNLRFGHVADHIDTRQFEEIVSLLGLKASLSDYPISLSGGQKERTAIGRALLGQPDLLFLDEPLGSTDFIHRLEIEDYISDRVRSSTMAAALVTHDLDQALVNADEILLLPPGGTGGKPRLFYVPESLRHTTPSQARIAPQLPVVTRDLIAAYEALL